MGFNYIFDFDGTIFNPYEGIKNALNQSIEDLKLDIEESNLDLILSRIGPPMKIMIKDIIPEKYSEQFVSLFRKYYDEEFCLQGYIYPYAKAFISKLSAKESTSSMAILSNKPLKPLKKICIKYNLEHFFDEVIGIDHPKFTGINKKEKLHNYFEFLNLENENCIFFGDRKDDFDAAIFNKCIFCGNVGKSLSIDQFHFLNKII